MRFTAIALSAAILAIGMPCPHVVHAMEMDASVSMVDGATMAIGAMDIHTESRPSAHQGISTRDDDSCCIKVATTSAEADHIQSPSDTGSVSVPISSIAGPVDSAISVNAEHPPDFQPPYHKRTVCQRE
jgi:hypothetical protein